jgi:hypothetical protein
MSGSAPFPARSPTQSNHYPPYSPTHPSRPYYSHDYHQPPQPQPPPSMQTPPPFAPASLVHSPHLSRQPSLTSPLPPHNSSLPPPPPINPTYHPLTSSPPYQAQRRYSGHMPPGGAPPYESTYPSHGNSTSRSGSSLQSPIKEHHPIQNGIHRDSASNASSPQSKEASLNIPYLRAD